MIGEWWMMNDEWEVLGLIRHSEHSTKKRTEHCSYILDFWQNFAISDSWLLAYVWAGVLTKTAVGIGFGPLLIHALEALRHKRQNFVKSPELMKKN